MASLFSVKNKELCALGYFVKKYSYLIDDVLRKEIKSTFWRTFQLEAMNTKKQSQNILCGFFTGFMHYCEIYKLQKENSEDNKLIKQLYPLLTKLAVLTNDRIKTANRGELIKIKLN